jgi:hypothetical protein
VSGAFELGVVGGASGRSAKDLPGGVDLPHVPLGGRPLVGGRVAPAIGMPLERASQEGALDVVVAGVRSDAEDLVPGGREVTPPGGA